MSTRRHEAMGQLAAAQAADDLHVANTSEQILIASGLEDSDAVRLFALMLHDFGLGLEPGEGLTGIAEALSDIGEAAS